MGPRIFPARRPLIAVLVALAMAIVGCSRKQPPEATNDAGAQLTIVDSARAAAGCRWIDGKVPEDGFLDPACPAVKVWEEKFGTTTAGQYEVELVELLPAPERSVRWVAARGLTFVRQPRWRKDDALARRLLARATGETDPSVGRLVGELVGSIWIADDSLSSPQFAEPVLAALRNGERPFVRAGVARVVLAANPKVPAVHAAVVSLARTPGPASPRIEALGALTRHSDYENRGSVDEATCALLLDASRDPDALVAANATKLIAGSRIVAGCPAKWDARLTGLAEDPTLAALHMTLLERVAELGTSKQQQQAVAILRRVVETKHVDSDTRSAALSAIGQRDPEARAFASRFLYDDDLLLRLDAARILGVEVPLGPPEDAGADAPAPPARPDGGARGK